MARIATAHHERRFKETAFFPLFAQKQPRIILHIHLIQAPPLDRDKQSEREKEKKRACGSAFERSKSNAVRTGYELMVETLAKSNHFFFYPAPNYEKNDRTFIWAEKAIKERE